MPAGTYECVHETAYVFPCNHGSKKYICSLTFVGASGCHPFIMLCLASAFPLKYRVYECTTLSYPQTEQTENTDSTEPELVLSWLSHTQVL